MSSKKENSIITINKRGCDYCGVCVAVCPEDCIELWETDIEIIDEKCTLCMLCVKVCPVEVMKEVTVPG